jgi:hypothetical protein
MKLSFQSTSDKPRKALKSEVNEIGHLPLFFARNSKYNGTTVIVVVPY